MLRLSLLRFLHLRLFGHRFPSFPLASCPHQLAPKLAPGPPAISIIVAAAQLCETPSCMAALSRLKPIISWSTRVTVVSEVSRARRSVPVLCSEVRQPTT
jgi:hypothetical protein